MTINQKICSRCILDTTVPGIRFDDRGVCNYCKIHDELEKRYPLNEMGQQKLNQLVDKIKSKGKGKKHDCIVGISGGRDSTYSLYMAKKLGLKPLAVHVDNGWFSDIAINNMKKEIEKLGVDSKIIKVDWEEFKDLQISFLRASVSDAEIPTDIAIYSVLYRVAAEEGIHYFINGHSFRTEGTSPIGWTYMDGRYIKSVHKMFGKVRLKSFPNLTISNLLYYIFVKRIKEVRLLEYIDYRRDEVDKILEKELDWTYYGGHRYDSIYARFNEYLHCKKFGIDDRKIEYSALIRSNQIIRDEALRKIKELLYSEEEYKEITSYVIEKLGLTTEEFEEIISSEPRTFMDYPTYYSIIKILRVPIWLGCKFNLLPGAFYDKYFR